MNLDVSENSPNKENKSLALILCLIFTIITIATIIAGWYFKNPFYVILGIVPAAIYEAIRTEGWYTKAASIAIAILVLAEILAIKGIIHLNLGSSSGFTGVYFAGYNLPLGNITFIFPAVAVILSLVLAYRTYGIYTKWLSILLLASSAVLVYMVSKETLFELMRYQLYFY